MLADYAMMLLATLLLLAGIANLVLASAAIGLNALQCLRRRRGDQIAGGGLGFAAETRPFVSVHVATHNEPADMVMATLDALAAMDYPAFEVLLIDNNTADPAMWRPVKDHIARLGARFRFFHREGVIGAKAGALNIGLAVCNPETRYVAVVDADYQVTPDFLTSAMLAFSDDIQFVQFPQAYRNSQQAKPVVAELSDYFRTFPSAANRSGASLLTGTLSVIAIDALRSVGGWPTASITEDAQLGVALWKAGARGLYVDKVVGRGLLPLDLAGLRIQRNRWVTGNIQTLLGTLRDWRSLQQRKGKVAVAAQLTAWSGFLAIPLVLLSTVIVIRFVAPELYDAVSSLWLWSQWIATQTLLISLGGLVMRALANSSPATLAVMLSLLWTSSFGWLSALTGRRLTFHRTPKAGSRDARRFSVDVIASWLALGLGVSFWISGSPLTAAALILAASGLVTGPVVNLCLRRAARQPETLSCPA